MRKIKSVFLVEDSEVDTWIAFKILEFAGITENILHAADGPQAITDLEMYALRNQALPEIILVDLSLPVMDGFELISKIKKLSSFNEFETQLILVTEGLDTDVDLPRIQQTGIKYVILKPLNKEKLVKLIENFECGI